MKTKLLLGLLAMLSGLAFASPSFAYDDVHPYPISRERAEALGDCNHMAWVVHPDYHDGHNRTAFYRACMYSHGEAE